MNADSDVDRTWSDLKGFNRDLVMAIAEVEDDADQTAYGLAVKRHLEDYYGEELYEHRLYSSLSTLEDRGIAAREPIDGRTDRIKLTERGRELLDGRARRLADAAGLDVAAVVADGGNDR